MAADIKAIIAIRMGLGHVASPAQAPSPSPPSSAKLVREEKKVEEPTPSPTARASTAKAQELPDTEKTQNDKVTKIEKTQNDKVTTAEDSQDQEVLLASPPGTPQECGGKGGGAREVEDAAVAVAVE